MQRTAKEIATASADNRYVGWPYTKYMNAMTREDLIGQMGMVGKDGGINLFHPEN